MKKIKGLWVSTIYYAQALPFSIVRQMTVVYFRDRGASLQSLGLVSLYGIPWTFKFLWSPIVDVYGSKRRWVLAMEMLLVCFIALVCSLVHGEASLKLIAMIFLAIGFVSATHDIAIDGYYLETLEKNDQAKYSGLLVAASRLAYLTGGGFLVSLAGKAGWVAAFGATGGILLLLFFWHSFLLTEIKKTAESDAEQLKKKQRKLWEGFLAFLKLPGIGQAIAFIFLFKLGDALLFGMSAPFLLTMMTKTEFGFYSGTCGFLAAMTASISGGLLISKYGLKKMLWVFGFIQNLAIPIYAVIAYYKPGIPWLVGAIIVEQFAAGWGASAYSNFVMRQNHPDFKATHYAIATGLMSFTVMIGGAISGFGAAKLGFPLFFTLAFFAAIPGMFLIPLIARRPECQPMTKR